jgi:dTDP-glucose 4,6-dehydratase
MRLLVTGGAGFIGSNFVRRLLTDSTSSVTKIIVLDKLTYAGTFENLEAFQDDMRFQFIHGDINNQTLVENLFEKVDAVVHFAAESHVDRSILEAAPFIETNVLGTASLLETLRKFPKVKFLHVSTDEVYGSINEGSWNEEFPISPNSPYAASKASSDLLALAYQRTYGLEILVSRCCNNYGPNQFPEKLIPLFITNLIQGRKVPVYGDGKNIREWIHVDDHCDALNLILSKGESGQIYNIGSSFELSNLEITNLILETFNRGEDSIEYVSDRPGHDYRYSLDYSKAKSKLGYSPKIDFINGLRKTVDWYLENQTWWDSKIQK